MIEKVYEIVNNDESRENRIKTLVKLYSNENLPIVRVRKDKGCQLVPLLEFAFSMMFEQEIRKVFDIEVDYMDLVTSILDHKKLVVEIE